MFLSALRFGRRMSRSSIESQKFRHENAHNQIILSNWVTVSEKGLCSRVYQYSVDYIREEGSWSLPPKQSRRIDSTSAERNNSFLVFFKFWGELSL